MLCPSGQGCPVGRDAALSHKCAGRLEVSVSQLECLLAVVDLVELFTDFSLQISPPVLLGVSLFR